MDFKYTLNSKKKFDCPSCHEMGRFVKYMDVTTGQYLEGDYGKCDRIESCGYHNPPPMEFIEENTPRVIFNDERNLFDSSSYPIPVYDTFYRNDKKIPNIFLRGIAKRFGLEAALKVHGEYMLGTFHDGSVIFPYFFDKELKSGKMIIYKNNLHRDKDKKSKWLHNWGNGNSIKIIMPDGHENVLYNCVDENKYNLALPLFGWDLLNKYPYMPICLVESEKTAVIASIVFPDFIWLATGGLYGLQAYKFPYHSFRHWNIFPDLGTIIYKEKTISVEDYWKMKIKEISTSMTIIDYYPPFFPENYSEEQKKKAIENQWDICDFILSDSDGSYVAYMRNVLEKFKKSL